MRDSERDRETGTARAHVAGHRQTHTHTHTHTQTNTHTHTHTHTPRHSAGQFQSHRTRLYPVECHTSAGSRLLASELPTGTDRPSASIGYKCPRNRLWFLVMFRGKDGEKAVFVCNFLFCVRVFVQHLSNTGTTTAKGAWSTEHCFMSWAQLYWFLLATH